MRRNAIGQFQNSLQPIIADSPKLFYIIPFITTAYYSGYGDEHNIVQLMQFAALYSGIRQYFKMLHYTGHLLFSMTSNAILLQQSLCLNNSLSHTTSISLM